MRYVPYPPLCILTPLFYPPLCRLTGEVFEESSMRRVDVLSLEIHNSSRFVLSFVLPSSKIETREVLLKAMEATYNYI